MFMQYLKREKGEREREITRRESGRGREWGEQESKCEENCKRYLTEDRDAACSPNILFPAKKKQ